MRVAIIGSGPAGLFCADRLAGACDVDIFESGLPIDKRVCPESGCKACKICHILEGEGGAGGLSDGKNTYSLTRGTQMEFIFEDKESKWMKYIDEQMVKFAGEGVWYDPVLDDPKEFDTSPLQFYSYPLRHVGSDGIRKFVRGFVDQLKRKHVRFKYTEVYPTLNKSQDQVTGIRATCEMITAEAKFDLVIIAAGLQGIPWIESFMMKAHSPLGSGPAGFGIRLEMNARVPANLHRRFYDYKITYSHKSGLNLRSFCCNQQGMVVNENHIDLGVVNVNGCSFLDPNLRTKSSNVAIIAKIPETFARFPQAFVRSVGKSINSRCDGGSAYQPILEFIGEKHKFNDEYMTNKQSIRADISSILDIYGIHDAFKSYILELNKIIPVISSTSVVYAPEIKYYGRRVNVTKEWKSKDIAGLYIIGSGSGHMDSFVAAALSGVIAAENIKKEGRNAT